MLSNKRILLQGHSEYPWETEALRFIREQLPDTEPYHVWELVELVDGAKGRIDEIDCLLLGYSALYLIEIKSGPGLYEGDATDWYRTAPGERARHMDPPYRLTNLKAKILKSKLDRVLQGNQACPWIQPLIFLSAEDLTLKLKAPGNQCVVTRKNLLRAVQFHELPGVETARRPNPINRNQTKEIIRALEQIGIRQSEGARRVGSFKLGALLEEGPNYEDREATHADRPGIRRRARIYLVPQQTTLERRQTLLRAADRESSVLEDLKDYSGILRIADYVTDSLVGPTVLFDHFDGIPLDAFLRSHPDLPFDQRIEIVKQVGLALVHCHQKKHLHNALSPSAVLIQEGSDGSLEVRLYNFQLAGTAGGTSTVHWTSLSAAPWSVYQAPELREDPSLRGPVTDLFSLGALAYFIFTGRSPGATGAEVDCRLADKTGPHHLDPRAVNDQVPPGLAEAVCFATELARFDRCNDVSEWLHDYFLRAATVPTDTALTPEIDPLLANTGDLLAGDLLVERVLGQGASSRVLQVLREKDDRSYALKVSLSSDEDLRLDAEAKVLQRLRHSNIVQLEERRILCGRTCLLITLAGSSTLSRSLQQEGAYSLDYASRYGEDLLLGLGYLEEEGVLHRDIKPGNLGVGTAGRSAYHLTLFDFSLAYDFKALDLKAHDLKGSDPAAVSLNQVGIGTTVYRDPFLRLRGAWDTAADRWSAAITLHEMLTGIRPSFEPEGTSALDADTKLVLAAERFDASVREQLVSFFQKALHRETGARYESAKAMRLAWNLAFELRQPPTSRHPDARGPQNEKSPQSERAPWTELELRGIAPETAVASLPLSSRALNALDRAGLAVAADLLELPPNRLSAIRGVGTRVAKEILNFRDQWRSLLPVAATAADCFLPAFTGPDIPISGLGLTGAAQRILKDAGIASLATLACTPKRPVEALLQRAKLPLTELQKRVAAAQKAARGDDHPASLAERLESLLPRQTKRRQNLEALFGLVPPFVGKYETPLSEVAAELGITRGALSVVVTASVAEWAAHPALEEVKLLLHSLVDAANPAQPVRSLALALLGRLGDTEEASPLKLAQAAALARMVTAVEREQPDGLHWVRIGERPWILVDAGYAPPLRELGRMADQLAQREILASPGEAARSLRAKVEGTPLAAASDEQLSTWAAGASQSAALSSRLELYPKGLSARRALELTSPVLNGKLTVDRVLTLVSSRYPEAEPLPPRPELDDLLEPFRLRWHPSDQSYSRPGESVLTVHSGSLTTLPSSFPPPSTPSQREIDPIQVEIRDFEERMRGAIQGHKLRILAASKTHSVRTALSLRDAFGLQLVNLDELLIEQLNLYMAEQGIEQDTVFTTDCLGEPGEDWPLLREVMKAATSRAAAQLFPVKTPSLLIQPGLLARFRLTDFIQEMVQAAQSPKSAACFLLVPGPDQGGVPAINGQLALPELSPTDVIEVSLNWLTRRKTAA